jgi:hypothetical protein
MKHCFLRLKTTGRLVIIVLLGILGLSQGFAYEFTEGNLVYSVEDGVYGLTVVRHKDGTSATGALIIPSELYHEGNLFTVTRIGERAFFDSPGLTSLVIPNAVTYIGRESFSGCSGITGNLAIPNLVTYIGRGAFWGCTGFSGGALTIPPSVELIEENAFTDCGFTVINYNATSCGVLLGYPHLSYHEESPFSGNSAKVSIGSSVTMIPNNFLRNCNIISEGITIPNSVTSIGGSAFYGCCNLSEITIPNSVTTIGDRAFQYCSSLTEITIPNSVTSIGAWAFADCSGLTCNLNLPNSLTSIGEGAFGDCSGLTGNLIIPNSVTSIGEAAFYGCSSLTGSIVISNSLTSIEPRVFEGCSGLTGNLTIPNSVTSIGVAAFSGCNGFTTVNISSSVISIGNTAFSTGPTLESITIAEGNSVFDSRGNCNAIIETATNKLICGCTNTVIPESVISIGDAAFGNRGLTSVTIPNSVTEIGFSAFYNCPNLVSVTIGSSVATIGNYAFANCSNLATVNLLPTTPPTITSNGTFLNNAAYFVIYVPYESLEAYMSAWGLYYGTCIRCMTQKDITGYGEGSGNWVFISSPVAVSTAPLAVENLLGTQIQDNPVLFDYDLYRFNQSSTSGEWENYHQHTADFVLENGKGYLYANKNDVTLTFSGIYSTDASKEIPLDYDGSSRFSGFNLVGNPFAEAATINRNYYKMNDEGTGLVAEEINSSEPIPPFTGVIVQATDENQSVTFTKVSQQAMASSSGQLNIALTQANTRCQTLLDNAIVNFNECSPLGKFYFGKQNANIYIPKNNEEYAIAFSDKQAETPINFKATQNGEYTITVTPNDVKMNYLHLIDNLTGNDVNLLQTPSYTFSARNDDYESRFRLIFNANDIEENETTDDFAFFNGSEWVINNSDSATLQVIDALGHIIISRRDGAYTVSTAGMTPGVYTLRLVKGENVKTQRIIIK